MAKPLADVRRTHDTWGFLLEAKALIGRACDADLSMGPAKRLHSGLYDETSMSAPLTSECGP